MIIKTHAMKAILLLMLKKLRFNVQFINKGLEVME